MSVREAIESRLVAAAMKGPEDRIKLPDGAVAKVVRTSIVMGTVTFVRSKDGKRVTLTGSEILQGNPEGVVSDY